MATPHVAGAVALLLSAKPWLTPFEVDSLLEATALDIFAAGKDNDSGSGRVQADSLLEAVASAVADGRPAVPLLTVRQNYPNPFNPITTIRFDLARRTGVRVEVFDISGRKVRTLARREFGAGAHEAVWNGTDDRGAPVSSGVYVYRVSAGTEIRSGTMVLLK
jgi:subtilisin family serine protease